MRGSSAGTTYRRRRFKLGLREYLYIFKRLLSAMETNLYKEGRMKGQEKRRVH
jgi:hypothetical protein